MRCSRLAGQIGAAAFGDESLHGAGFFDDVEVLAVDVFGDGRRDQGDPVAGDGVVDDDVEVVTAVFVGGGQAPASVDDDVAGGDRGRRGRARGRRRR